MSTLAVIQSDRNIVGEFLLNFTSENTRKAYKRDLSEFVNFLKQNQIETKYVVLGHLISYRDLLSDKGNSPATVSRKLSAIRSLYTWCTQEGFLDHNPAANLKLPKTTPESPTLAFTDEEVRNILALPDSSTFNGNVHKLILVTLFNLGLRRSELVNIKMKDIQTDRGVTTLLVRGKGDKKRLLPLNSNVLVHFDTYLSTYSLQTGMKLNPEDYLIQAAKKHKNEHPMDGSTIYRIVNKYAKSAGVTRRIGAHSCRATVISHLLENQVSPRDVADFAGHASINTTIGSYDKKRLGLKNSAAFKVNFQG